MEQKCYETFFTREFVNKIMKKEAGSIILHNEGKLPLHQSKVGGIGYFPKNKSYPIGILGNPLHLLATVEF